MEYFSRQLPWAEEDKTEPVASELRAHYDRSRGRGWGDTRVICPVTTKKGRDQWKLVGGRGRSKVQEAWSGVWRHLQPLELKDIS